MIGSLCGPFAENAVNYHAVAEVKHIEHEGGRQEENCKQ